jgi:class 3 adenylate cyclase/tetratricopeptide (TPR) repeat protein
MKRRRFESRDGEGESVDATRSPVPTALGSLPSGTVTFAFTDIEGSTVRWERDRAAMQDAVRRHDALMRDAVAAFGGHVFKTIGDAFCVAFARPEDAVAAMLDAQRALGAEDFSAVDGIRVRVAIHTGTADERDADYFGPAVNRVARLLAIAYGGQVLVSGATASLIHGTLPPGASLADLGNHRLKDLAQPEHVYQLRSPELPAEFPALLSLDARSWLVPDAMRTRYFTGREDVLATLRSQLVERRRAVLSGLGGVGKTQTAIEYAVRHRVEYPDGVFWVNAETAGGLARGFVEIAQTLHLPAAAGGDQERVVAEVLQWLNGRDRWLLILDNVEDRREIRPFVPKSDKGHVLMTSRESVFQEFGIVRGLEVPDFDGDDALRFLLMRADREDAGPDERNAAADLAREVGNLPLALEQAGAYITETNAAFAAYLSALRKRRLALMEKAVGLVSRDTVAVTWVANLEAVERASLASAEILRISAFLAPDAIPFELFLDAAQEFDGPIAEALADPDELSMAELLRPLARYSLIRSDPISRAFSVHRLVQEVARASLAEPERKTCVEHAVGALDRVFPIVEFSNWEQCERLVPHVAAVAGWVDSSIGRPEAAGRLMNRAGEYLFRRGRRAEARPLYERALAIREKALGPHHPDVAESLNNMAELLGYEGRYAEAQPLCERSLAIGESALGPHHPDVARSLHNLAVLHFYQGRYAEAQPLQERALIIRENALGPDHPDVARSQNNLATLHHSQGRYAEARPLYERALATQELTLGPHHPDVGRCLNNLGELHRQEGRYAEAQPLHERVLAIRERALGPDHPDFAFSLHNLGAIHASQGRYAEAKPLFERALAIFEKALGAEHPLVASSLKSLAQLHDDQHLYAQAQTLYERALAIQEKALGPDHPDLGASLNSLAELHRQQERYGEAQRFHERALAIRQKALEPDHADIAESLNNLAELRRQRGG